MSVGLVPNKYWLLLSMVGVGIAWTSVLPMPYAILAPKLPPEKMGIYMGIFNFFIVIPEIMATLFFGFVMSQWLDNDRMSAVMLGGCMMFMAAVAVMFVDDKT
jgi:maltose/moltooligosaccharide transporter